MRFLFFFLLFAIAGAGTGQAQDNSVKKPYSLQRAADYLMVDPLGFKPKPSNKGWLIAYTDTQEYNDGQIRYYPHTPYRILDLNGKILKKIPNHISNNDETPTAVSLEPGFYLLETPWKKTLVELKTGCVTKAVLYTKN